MATTMSAMEFRSHLGDLLSRAVYTGETFIIQRRGRPVAVLVSIDHYEKLAELEAKQRLARFERIRQTDARNDLALDGALHLAPVRHPRGQDPQRMKAVLDSGVLIAFLLSKHPALSRALDGWEVGEFEPLTSAGIIADVERASSEARPAPTSLIQPQKAQALIDALREDATHTLEKIQPSVIAEDPEDNLVLACAVEGGAHYIVSTDFHLLALRQYEGIPIIGPEEFATVLGFRTNNHASSATRHVPLAIERRK